MKYGWEICDEVQRHVGNTSEIQFIPKSEHDKSISEINAHLSIARLASQKYVDEAREERDKLKYENEQLKLQAGLALDFGPSYELGLKHGGFDKEYWNDKSERMKKIIKYYAENCGCAAGCRYCEEANSVLKDI